MDQLNREAYRMAMDEARARFSEEVADIKRRVRLCRCGRRFYANTKKKIVCSDACRFAKWKEKQGRW